MRDSMAVELLELEPVRIFARRPLDEEEDPWESGVNDDPDWADGDEDEDWDDSDDDLDDELDGEDEDLDWESDDD